MDEQNDQTGRIEEVGSSATPPAPPTPQAPYPYPAPGFYPTPGTPAQPYMYPMAAGWAPGVQPVPIGPRRGRARWVAAIGIVMIVVLVTGAAAFVLSGANGVKSLTASAAPKDTLAFVELRIDLPGDQRQKLADFMSHFPGFQDRAQFDNALDEMFNRITRSVSPDIAYTSAFKPWMEGEVSVAVTSLGGMTSGPVPTPVVLGPDDTFPIDFGLPGNYSPPGEVLIVALKDRTAAKTWLDGEVQGKGIQTTTESYAGATITTISDTGLGDDFTGAYALITDNLILGTVSSVKASLDTKTKGSLADSSRYQTAMKSISGDSLMRFYVDAESYLSQTMALAAATLPVNAGQIPTWMAGSVHAESDRMVAELYMPKPSGVTIGTNHTSRLAASLPGNTVAVEEVHDVGQTVTTAINTLKSEPGIDPSSLAQVEKGLQTVGGVDWIRDGAVVVTKSGSDFGGGIVVEAPDADTAQLKLDTWTNLAALAGSSMEIKSTTETYKGHEITLLDVPVLVIADTNHVQIALAKKDNLIVAGYTDAFVKAVIDTTADGSLAAQSDYKAIMSAVGSSNTGSAYLDVPALEDVLGQYVTPDDAQRWTLDYKPYFDHLGPVGYATIDGSVITERFVVMAR